MINKTSFSLNYFAKFLKAADITEKAYDKELDKHRFEFQLSLLLLCVFGQITYTFLGLSFPICKMG